MSLATSKAVTEVSRTDHCTAVFAECTRHLIRLQDIIADSSQPLGDLPLALREVERLAGRVDAVRSRIIAAAHAAGEPDRCGDASTGAWVAKHGHLDGRKAASAAKVAEWLGNEPIAPSPAEPQPQAERDQTRVAFDAGDISADHVLIIRNTLAGLPDSVTVDQRILCERKLIEASKHRPPAQVRLLARRVLEQVVPPEDEAVVDSHESAQLASEEDRAHDSSRFWIKDNRDGTMTGQFTIPTLAGLALRKIIDAMTAPRRQDRHLAGNGPRRVDGVDDGWSADQLDWQLRRGLAFTQLLEHLPTDHLHDKAAATVIVTTRLDDLREQIADLPGQSAESTLGRSAQTDCNERISPGEARRIACGAGLIPAVLGGDSIPLDLGRQSRLFTAGQRAALATKYSECATDGCDRPFAWCELHHLTAWSRGGNTDLRDGVPLCGTHHRQLHRGHPHTVHRRPGGEVRLEFHRRS